jgi:uncharacterized protein YndB with AHSA1/START domain
MIMTASQITVERRIAAPADRVWKALTDIEAAPQTISGIDRIEMLSEGPFGVGTRWRETRRMLGKEATEEMYVTACEAPSRYVVEADSHGTHYVSEFALTPGDDDATTVRMVFDMEGEPKGFTKVVMKLIGPIAYKAAAKAMTKDLADVAAAVEASA